MYHNTLTHQRQQRMLHAILLPDMHAIDYPTGRLVVNDSGANATAEVFFEKPSHYINPENRRAKSFVSE